MEVYLCWYVKEDMPSDVNKTASDACGLTDKLDELQLTPKNPDITAKLSGLELIGNMATYWNHREECSGAIQGLDIHTGNQKMECIEPIEDYIWKGLTIADAGGEV